MGKTIAITNQKGGVGKTTTAINLSAAMAELGKKILVIDTDPQGNMTSGFGVNKNEVENTVYELMLGSCSTEEAIIKNVKENKDKTMINKFLMSNQEFMNNYRKKHSKTPNKVRRQNHMFVIN